MSHDLFKNTMAYVGKVPWHVLGKKVEDSTTAEDMCKAASLDWKVTKVPAPGARIIKSDPETYERYLITREAYGDETDIVAFGMVGPGYEPLQNMEAFQFFDPFIRQQYAKYHTAGALGNGERVWVLVKLSENIVIKKHDAIEKYLLLSNSHDGRGAVTVRFTPIRVVCQNTLSYAMKESKGIVSVRHTKNISRYLADAQAEELRKIIEHVFSDAEHLFGAMAAKEITVEHIDATLDIIFPRTEIQKKERKQPERWQRIKAILDDERVTPRDTRGTLWGLYNAIVRDEDFRKTRETLLDSRLERVWFGSGNDLKLKTLDVFRKLAA
jgi:phage/plasmid-like protein (TIGR03299 family)